MSIITISRQLGSLGANVAAALRDRTKAQFLDRENVEARMQQHGIPTDRLARLDERPPGIFERLTVHADRYRHFLRMAILDLAATGDCVILGRGANVVLADVPGVLRVRVVAPRDTRVRRVRDRLNCSEAAALRRLKESDKDRAGFLRFHFGAEWSDPEAYDLVVSTASLRVEAVADLVLDAAERLPITSESAVCQRLLGDRCLEQHVRTALIFHGDAPLYFLSVSARDGVVTLHGETTSAAQVDRSEELTRGVPGVVHVNNKIVHLQRHPALPV